ncbi:hypothetical protein O7598_25480 [Micromonospora sp. WMMC241]|uniref:hypothetical protein n=1 Tax=Micromonospora sp. WMMC241 TaxID=3015159 RepID=UPI0022B735CC|nr:hypothetical protein [Micromonospora sp. WMMC241]MCZ7439778.1 hypothetical protein [Micromonospora sp. WMMC241]
MPDDVTLVEVLHRDLRDVRWAEPAELRATARRRSRRTAALAAASVMLVAALGATFVDRTGASPPPVADVPGGNTEIPVEAMLEPTDVPVRTGDTLSDTDLDEPVRVDDFLQVCARAQGLPAQEPRSRYSRSQTMLNPPPEAQPSTPTVALTQDVYRMPSVAASRFVGDLERAVAACGGWRTTGQVPAERGMVTGEVVHSWTVAASGFAGDQAVVLRHTTTVPQQPADGGANRFEDRLVVRVGDLVTVLVPAGRLRPGIPDAEASVRQLQEMGRAAAERMCVAANPGC